MSSPIALVDNLQVENFAKVLTGGFLKPPNKKDYAHFHEDIGHYYLDSLYFYGDSGCDFVTYREALNRWLNIHKNQVLSLINLLDVLVLYEDIYFDKTWSASWLDIQEFQKASKMFKSIEFLDAYRIRKKGEDYYNEDELERIKLLIMGQSWDYKYQKCNHDNPFENLISAENVEDRALNAIRDGAIFYYNLSRIIGAHYWPAPQRSEYLSQQLLIHNTLSYVIEFVNKAIKDKLEEIMINSIFPLTKITSSYLFPSFGSIILSECKKSTDIIPKIINYRDSPEIKSFRKWIENLDDMCQKGNIYNLEKEAMDLKNILNSITKRKNGWGSTQIQIGISPSITFTPEIFKNLFSNSKKKNNHLIFIRNYMERLMTNADLWRHIYRLFPEIGKNH